MNTTPPRTSAISGLSPDAFSSLFQAIGGLRNRRALLAMVGCLFAGVLVAGVLTALAGRMGGAFLGALLMFVAGATGVNSAGVLLMDQAKGVPLRSIPDAIVYGLMCIPKFIALGIVLLLVALAVFIVLALVFVVCKIPFLGPLMFAVVFPVSVVIAGLTLWGLSLCLFLALPAVWEGAGIMHALAQALAIARSRLVEALLLMAVVGVLSMIVGFIVFGVLGTGLAPTMAMSASIVGGGMGGLQSVIGMAQGYGMEGSGGAGYAIAGAIGGGLLWALALSLVSLVYLLGLNLVYLRVTEGLDTAAAEAAMKSGFDDAKRRATELSHKAKEAAERAREQASAAMAPKPPAEAPPAYSPAVPPPAYSPPPVVTPPAPPPAATSVAPVAAASLPTIIVPPAPAPAPPAPPAPTEPPEPSAPPSFAPTLPPAIEPAPVRLACPQCLSAVTADDQFCGVCGYKLK
ncbi:hypothetical protein BH11PSE9_BH11PSE9_16280 [soil metagenome]